MKLMIKSLAGGTLKNNWGGENNRFEWIKATYLVFYEPEWISPALIQAMTQRGMLEISRVLRWGMQTLQEWAEKQI